MVGLVLFFGGVALVCYGFAPRVRFRIWREDAISVWGVIVDNVPQRTNRKEVSWLPIVEFDADGRTIRSLPSDPTRSHGWQLGSPVEVLYSEGNPHRTHLADTRFPLSSLAVLGFGLIGLCIAYAAT
jgi:hypothetical protein